MKSVADCLHGVLEIDDIICSVDAQIVQRRLKGCCPDVLFARSYQENHMKNKQRLRYPILESQLEDPAFWRIGIDFAGPLYVKDIYRRAEMNKCSIAVFTCASSRALHLELVPNLTADSFIRVFKRFIGRPGIPSVVVSA